MLPFLLDEKLVARVDLKADRKAKALLVQKETLEGGAPPEARERLAEALDEMAKWLGLDQVIFAEAARGQ